MPINSRPHFIIPDGLKSFPKGELTNPLHDEEAYRKHPQQEIIIGPERNSGLLIPLNEMPSRVGRGREVRQTSGNMVELKEQCHREAWRERGRG